MTAPPLPRPEPYFQTTHIYADGTLTVVFTALRPEGMVTTVTDGPLHDSQEITTIARSLDGLRGQHMKWLWRVLNSDRTHPEYFARKAKRLAQVSS